jgi:hypothetical protein
MLFYNFPEKVKMKTLSHVHTKSLKEVIFDPKPTHYFWNNSLSLWTWSHKVLLETQLGILEKEPVKFV